MIIAVDTETTGLHRYKGHKPFGIGICYEDKSIDYIDCPVDPRTRQPNWDIAFTSRSGRTLIQLRTILEDPAIDKVFHNAKFDMHMLESIGIYVRGQIHDTVLMARACNSQEKSYKLKVLAEKYLKINNDDEIDLKKAAIKARKKLKDEGFVVGEAVEQDYWAIKWAAFGGQNDLCENYCTWDVIRTMRLYKYFKEGMRVLGREYNYYEIDQPLIPLLYKMETTGVKVRKKTIDKLFTSATKRTMEIDIELREKYSLENANSGQQRAEVLVDKLGLDFWERTKPSKTFPDGQIKTSTEVLLRTEEKHPIIDLLIERSALNTGKNYLNGYLNFTNSNDILHFSLNTGDTRTWRLSSSDPNLQNITNPFTSRNNFAVNGRSCFGPRKNHIWVAIDYSQIELRIWAHCAQIASLLENYRKGIDGHETTRKAIPYLLSMDKQRGRKLSKHANFTCIYGGNHWTLYIKYGIPERQGRPLVKGFKEAYPEGVEFEKHSIEFAQKHGHIETVYGRKIDTPSEYKKIKTTAVNYQIQSAAADLMKKGMLRCQKWLDQIRLDVKILLSVHDELIFEIHKDIYSPGLVKTLMRIMEDHQGVFCIDTPVEASIILNNWGDKVEF